MARFYMNSELEMQGLQKTSLSRQSVLEVEDLETITFTRFLKTFERIILKSLPAIIVMELTIFSQVANMFFVSGSRDVIGVGFGTIWLNITMKGVLLNTNMSIGTIMNKYFRQNNHFKVGVCYQKGLLISGVYLVIITPFLGYSWFFFDLIGLEDNITDPGSRYAWEAVPSIWAFAYFDMTKNYLQSMNIYYPLILIQVFIAVIHLGLADTLIVGYGLSLRGAAWAKNISETVQAFLIYFYILKYHSNHPSWIEWDGSTFKSLSLFLKSIMKIGLKNFIQGCSFEVMILFAGHLKYVEMSVAVCLAFTAQAIFMIYLGITQTVQGIIIQNFKNTHIYTAKTKAGYFVISTLMVGILIGIVLHIFRYQWIDVFGLGPEGSDKLLSLLLLFTITMQIDGIQIILSGILNALGFFTYTLNVQLFAQYGIGIISGLYLAYWKKRELEGLWLGWAIGLACSSFLLLTKLSLVDWVKAAKDILVPTK